jgi:hypothetical protein
MRGRHMRKIILYGLVAIYYMSDILCFTKPGHPEGGGDPCVSGACGSQADPSEQGGWSHKKTAPGKEAVFILSGSDQKM